MFIQLLELIPLNDRFAVGHRSSIRKFFDAALRRSTQRINISKKETLMNAESKFQHLCNSIHLDLVDSTFTNKHYWVTNDLEFLSGFNKGTLVLEESHAKTPFTN